MSAHSHLGASGAERWLRCPGSATLAQRFHVPGDSGGAGPDYRWQGSTAHAGADHCLQHDLDAWEVAGMEFEGHVFSPDMSASVQLYLDVVRQDFPGADLIMFEQKIHVPEIHPAMFGTTDCSVAVGEWLVINDYKHGAGVSVDVVENPQEMYYATMVLARLRRERPDLFAKIAHIRLRIIQPNDLAPEARVRVWNTTPEHIITWAATELEPGMRRADTETGLMVGDHCRFCPARLVCPAQRGLFAALVDANAANVEDLSDEDLGRDYHLAEAAKHRIRLLEQEVFRRLMDGREFREAYLTIKKADRVWNDGAADRFVAEYGQQAYTDPALKSPAQMEKLPGAKALVKEWAFTPQNGYTVAPIGSKKRRVAPPRASERFAAFAQQQEKDNAEDTTE